VASVLALTVFRSVAGAHALLPAVPLLLCAGSSIRDRPPNSVRGRVFGSLEDAMASVAEMSRTMSRFRLSLAPEPEAPARARECVAHACAQWGVEHVLNEARLVVSELVTNAVKHAGSGIELQLMLRDAFLHVRVRDGSSAPPVMPPESPSSAVGGRGLKLVDLYASGWGSLSGAGGKVVWATLRVRPIGSRESEQRR
jgi:anti-sigma regulatory factor (Ser/Thr protein kinase)